MLKITQQVHGETGAQNPRYTILRISEFGASKEEVQKMDGEAGTQGQTQTHLVLNAIAPHVRDEVLG